MSRRPEEILIAAGFLPETSAAQRPSFERACREGLDEVVTAWLELGMSPNAHSRHGSPLIAAAEGGHVSTIGILVAHGADLERRDASDDTAVRVALDRGHREAVRFLASKGADLDAIFTNRANLLAQAIDDDHDENRRLLLELGANPSSTKDDWPPMQRAVYKGAAIVEELLDAGVSPSLTLDDAGRTVLHYAVWQEAVDVVDLVIDRGASLEAKDAYGRTPLDYALLIGNEDLVATLSEKTGSPPSPLQRARAQLWGRITAGELDDALSFMEREGVPIDARSITRSLVDETPLMAFATAGHLEGVHRLLRRGAQTEGAVDRAVMYGHDDVLAALLEAGASPLDESGIPAGIAVAVPRGYEAVLRRLLDACPPKARAGAAPYVERAVSARNAAMTKALVEKGVPLDHRDDIGGVTPLIRAVSSYHDHEIVRVLLEGGARVDVVDSADQTPLHNLVRHYAWDQSFEPTLCLLLEHGARLDAIDAYGFTPWTGAKDGAKRVLMRELVTEPIERRVSVTELAKRHSWATLAIVLEAGQPNLLAALVDAGVDVDPPQGTRVESVLHAAIKKGDIDAVHALIARGANVNHPSVSATPLMLAARKDIALLQLLLDAGADPKQTLPNGRHALHEAVGRLEHLRLLVARGAKLDDRVDTPLMVAASRGCTESTRFLLDHGARVDVRDPDGRTPLGLAVEAGSAKVVRMLVEAGASVTAVARDTGETPLTAAVKKGDVEIAKLLLSHGGSLEDMNKAGEVVLALILRRRRLREAFSELLTTKGITVSAPKLVSLPQALTIHDQTWAAVYGGDESGVMRAIERGELAVDDRDPWGVTPLMAAVLRRREGLVRHLLERGANPDLRDAADAVAWDYFGVGRDETIADLLKKYSRDRSMSLDLLNAQERRELLEEELDLAVTSGDIANLEAMLREKKVHPFLGTDGTPVIVRASHDEDLLDALLELGFSPDTVDAEGRSLLEHVVSRGDAGAAQRLVDAGARIDVSKLLAVAEDEALEWLWDRYRDEEGEDA